MTANLNEEIVTEPNYLQMYQDHVSGYKQYKMEKHPHAAQTAEPAAINEVPVPEALYYSTNKSG